MYVQREKHPAEAAGWESVIGDNWEKLALFWANSGGNRDAASPLNVHWDQLWIIVTPSR